MSHIGRDHCVQYLNEGAVPKADADISGIGVVLAFVLGAYITLAAVLLAYATGYVDADLPNAVDTRVFRVRPYAQKNARLHTAISKGILALGDQQIVTGIAILGAGFQGLRTGNISVYHYQIVLYLAWMSSSVHLSALTILGGMLTRNPGLMVWRITGMLVLLVLLIVALIPTLSNDWGLTEWDGMLPGHSGWGIPARCFWGGQWGEGINSDSVIGFVILGVSYVWKVGALFPRTGTWYNRWIRRPQEAVATKALIFVASRYRDRPTWYWLWAFRLTLTAALPIFAAHAMLASFAASLWLTILGLVFGTMQVVIPRDQNLWYTAEAEEQWSFGQLVPLILLVQPLGVISEHLWPGEQEDAERDTIEDAHRRRVSVVSDRSSDVRPIWETFEADTLLHWLASRTNSSAHALSADLAALLHESRLFGILVALINCGILITGVIVYVVDAYSIGNAKVPKWEVTAQSVGYCAVGILAIEVALVPFSRLGRTRGSKGLGWKRKRTHGRLLGTAGPDQRDCSVIEMAQMKP